MTVRERSVSCHIDTEFKRDRLVQLLWQRTTAKRRRELVVSAAKTSLTSHISRKLLLEEHKLELRLEQIEKERRQFISKNNNEIYMLQLSVRSLSCNGREKHTTKGGHNMNQNPVHTIQRTHSEGNVIFRRTPSPTNAVYLKNGANILKQLQIQKVYLARKHAEERRRLKSLLSWKRDYVIPQVPPPSRSPSNSDLLLVRLKSTFNESEEDSRRMKEAFRAASSLWNSKTMESSFESEHEVCHETKNAKAHLNLAGYPEKHEAVNGVASGVYSAAGRQNGWMTPRTSRDTPDGKIVIPSTPEERGMRTNYVEQKASVEDDYAVASRKPRVTSSTPEIEIEPLSPSVKGLSISRGTNDDVFRSTPGKSNHFRSEGEHTNEVYPTKLEEKNKEGETSARDLRSDQKRKELESRSSGKIEDSREDVGSDRKTRTHRKTKGRKTATTPSSRFALNSLGKNNGQKTVGRGKREEQPQTMKVEEMTVHAKNFLSAVRVNSKVNKNGKTVKVTEKEENKRTEKSRTWRSKSGTAGVACSENGLKISRKNCSACAAERFHREGATPTDERSSVASTTASESETKKVHIKSPLRILLVPSPSQMQGFEKVAKKKIRKNLAIHRRRELYGWTLPFNQKHQTIDSLQRGDASKG